MIRVDRSKFPIQRNRAEPRCPDCGGRLDSNGLYWECRHCGQRRGRRFKHDPDGWEFTPLRYGDWPFGGGAPLDPALWPVAEE